jgi:hypothetical protein
LVQGSKAGAAVLEYGPDASGSGLGALCIWLPSSEAMGDIVNLHKVRKQATRKQRAARAAENRVVHGRGKAERAVAEAREAKNCRDLDQHRMQTTNNDQTGEGR